MVGGRASWSKDTSSSGGGGSGGGSSWNRSSGSGSGGASGSRSSGGAGRSSAGASGAAAGGGGGFIGPQENPFGAISRRYGRPEPKPQPKSLQTQASMAYWDYLGKDLPVRKIDMSKLPEDVNHHPQRGPKPLDECWEHCKLDKCGDRKKK